MITVINSIFLNLTDIDVIEKNAVKAEIINGRYKSLLLITTEADCNIKLTFSVIQ